MANDVKVFCPNCGTKVTLPLNITATTLRQSMARIGEPPIQELAVILGETTTPHTCPTPA